MKELLKKQYNAGLIKARPVWNAEESKWQEKLTNIVTGEVDTVVRWGDGGFMEVEKSTPEESWPENEIEKSAHFPKNMGANKRGYKWIKRRGDQVKFVDGLKGKALSFRSTRGYWVDVRKVGELYELVLRGKEIALLEKEQLCTLIWDSRHYLNRGAYRVWGG